jgi:hypothetical protein
LKLDVFRRTSYGEGRRGRFLSKTKKPLRRFDPLANAIAQELPILPNNPGTLRTQDARLAMRVMAGRTPHARRAAAGAAAV